MPVSDPELSPRAVGSAGSASFKPWRLFPWFRTPSGSPSSKVSLSKQHVVKPVLKSIEPDGDTESQAGELQDLASVLSGHHTLLEAERINTKEALLDAMLLLPKDTVEQESDLEKRHKEHPKTKSKKRSKKRSKNELQVPQLQDQLEATQLPQKRLKVAINLSPQPLSDDSVQEVSPLAIHELLVRELDKKRRSKHRLRSDATPTKRYKKYNKTRSAILINPSSESEEDTTVVSQSQNKLVVIEGSTEVEEVEDSDASNYNNPLPVTPGVTSHIAQDPENTSHIIEDPEVTLHPVQVPGLAEDHDHTVSDIFNNTEHDLSRIRVPMRDVSTQTPQKLVLKKTYRPHLTEKERNLMSLVQKSASNSPTSFDIEEDVISNSSPQKGGAGRDTTSTAHAGHKHRAPSISKPNLVEVLHRLDTNTPDYILRAEELSDKQAHQYDKESSDSSSIKTEAHTLPKDRIEEHASLFVDPDSGHNEESNLTSPKQRPRPSQALEVSEDLMESESDEARPFAPTVVEVLHHAGDEVPLKLPDGPEVHFEPSDDIAPHSDEENATLPGPEIAAETPDTDSDQIDERSNRTTPSKKPRKRSTPGDEDYSERRRSTGKRKKKDDRDKESSPEREYLKYPAPTPFTADGRPRHPYILNLAEILIEQGRQGTPRRDSVPKKNRPRRILLRNIKKEKDLKALKEKEENEKNVGVDELDEASPGENDDSTEKNDQPAQVNDTTSENKGTPKNTDASSMKEGFAKEAKASNEKPTPSRAKGTPKEKDTPSKDELTPSKKKGTPSKDKSTPLIKKGTPPNNKSTSSDDKGTSSEVKQTATQEARRTRSSTKKEGPTDSSAEVSYVVSNFAVDEAERRIWRA